MNLPLLVALAAITASAPCAGDAAPPAHAAESRAGRADSSSVASDVISTEIAPSDDHSPSGTERSGWATPVLQYALLEGIIAAWSVLAANYPEATGWTMVGLSPLSFMNLQPRDTVEAATVFASGMAGLGLWGALELRAERYSTRERLLINFAAWNVVGIATELTTRVTRSERRAGHVALGVAPRGDGAMLLLRGRF